MLVAQDVVEYNTRAFSIENGDPILETTDNNLTLCVTPQVVKYYNCQGNIESQHIQYNFSIYTKFMGMMNVIAEQTISGQMLCLVKVLAQKTKDNMANGGKEGLVIDNGGVGSGTFRIEVSEIKPFMMRRGWYMQINTGVVSQTSTGFYTIGRKATLEFIEALSSINVE